MVGTTKIHPRSKDLGHLVDLFLFKGAPENLDPDRDVEILINHGFITGYCPERLQPIWSAYRVAHADQDVDYDRPHLYYADERLDADVRLDARTFGKKDDIAYHVGHMVPNEVINRQFGRLAQMETFFMSNMCPQRGSLNTGVWLTLENKIRNIEDTDQRDHVWAIAGPVFDDDPDTITHGGKDVPIPAAFYYITIDPHSYPWDRESNVDVACFLIPQDAPGGTPLHTYLKDDISEIEALTKLSFFPGWEAELATAEFGFGFEEFGAERRHRLLRQLFS